MRGKIWDLNSKKLVDKKTLINALAQKRFVLLGEKHDNATHHQYQADLLQALSHRRPVVAWEMITLDESKALADYLASKDRNAAGLGKAITWEKRGWFSWQLYLPIAEVALAANLAFVPAGISRKAIWSVFNHTSKSEATPSLPSKLPPQARSALAKTITVSHCGHANQRMIDMMITLQEMRDDFMAKQLVGKEPGHALAVLIAGSGHSRQDRGAPYHLRHTHHIPANQILSIGMVEVAEDSLRPDDYVDYQPGGPPPFDYLWFAERVDNEDPCEKFKGQLKQLHKHKPSSHGEENKPGKGNPEKAAE